MTTRTTSTLSRAPLRSSLAAAALALAALACNPSVGEMSATEGGSESGETGESGESGDFSPCSSANPCPDGQFCFNGLCALGCNSNDDCAADQYCDTEFDRLCHNKTVSTCPDTPCPEGQECVNGFCSAGKESGQCEQMPNGEDGCDKSSLCIEDLEAEGEFACYPFPACAADDTCPIGTQGAVCNTGYLPSKNKICLIGLCEGASHCPAEWSCVKFGGEVLGLCSSGSFGEPCNSGAECISGNCMVFFPGEPGICQ